jgi:GTP-binding protein EngB required for normal cell division
MKSSFFTKPLKTNKKKTEFFKGDNLFDILKTSTFGLFNKTINNLGISVDEFQLPSVIIIGTESAGKSSLIQNILKCPIFPIDNSIATKVPIKLELINSKEEKYIITFQNNTVNFNKKEEILGYVEKIMKDLRDLILDDELNIKFYHPNVFNYTFYDLPGIREFPENLRIKTKNITDKYINKPNTIVICVVPATSTRLTSNQALGMVIDSNKCIDCIIALTMVDKLQDYEIEDKLLNRILNKTDELNNINIEKIIGVINNNNINEIEWFNNNIIRYIEDNNKPKVIENLTLNQLLIQLDIKYHNYIKNNWKQKALIQIDKSINKLNQDYLNLGEENLDINIIINHIKNECCKVCYSNFKSRNDFDCNDWIILEQKINEFLDYKNLTKNCILNFFSDLINNIFEKDKLFKLERFKILKDKYQIIFKKIIETNLDDIDKWILESIKQSKYNLTTPKDFLKFYDLWIINISRHIDIKLRNIDNSLIITDDILIESNEYKQKRNIIKNDIKKYQEAKEKITNIENYIKRDIKKDEDDISDNSIDSDNENDFKEILKDNIKKNLNKNIGFELF